MFKKQRFTNPIEKNFSIAVTKSDKNNLEKISEAYKDNKTIMLCTKYSFAMSKYAIYIIIYIII